MAAPDTIDPNSIVWQGPAGDRQKKVEGDITQSAASTRSSNASAATSEAKLPYVPIREAAGTKKDVVDTERFVKGNVLSEAEQTAISEIADQFQRFDGLYKGFKQDYAGSGLDMLGDAENTIQSKFKGFGTPGQQSWWQSMSKGDLLERHKYFGASLTTGEKEAWSATTVTPGMDPAIVKANIAKRRELAAKALARKIGTYIKGDYRPEQLAEVIGPDLYKAFEPGAREQTLQLYAKDRSAAERGLTGDEPADETGTLGESIKAPRLPKAVEEDLNSYVRSDPNATPEGYAQRVVEANITNGILPEEARDAVYAATLEKAKTYFESLGPVENRAKIGPGLDYSEADKAAQQEAGIGDVALQAAKNVPESLVGLAEGTIALPVDALVSLTQGERYGSFKSLTDLGGELLSAAGGAGSGPNMQAFGDMLNERYGSLAGFKNAVAKDPAGVAGDLSLVLTGGGSAAARLPGVAGDVGSAVRTAGRALDPMSAAVGAAELLPQGVAAIPEGVKNAPGAVTGIAMGIPTGVPGGRGFRTAASAGFERGLNGPNQRSQRFLEQLRGGDPTEVVTRAEEAVRNIQAEASRAYDTGMVDTRNDATVLDFADIDQTLNDLRDRAYFNGQVKNQRAAAVHERMQSLVDEWKSLDPAQFHTPQGMDALKQRIGDVGDDFRQNNDRRAASIADGVYNATRRSIARQVPTYDRTMRQYEQAQRLLRQIRTTFSINPNASVDTQLRKLQSLMRNNANTNYSYRADLGRLLEDRGGVDVMDDLSAQSISSWTPRGLMGLAAGTVGAGAGAGAMAQLINPLAEATSMLNPANALALPLMSPRAMGEASYAAGATAGGLARGARGAYRAAEPTLSDLKRRYDDNPTAFLAASRAGEGLREIEERQSAPPPPIDTPESITSGELPATPEGVTIDPETGDIILPDGTRVPLKGYAGGGAVKRTWGDTGREVAKGATFAWSDEIEALARSLAQGDPGRYREIVNSIRSRQGQAAEAAPYKSIGWEMAGAMAPALAARRPAALDSQLGRLAARYPRVAGAMRARPKLTSFGVDGIADAGMAALYAMGEANNVDEIPAKMAEEVPMAMAMYGGMGAIGSGLRGLYNKYRRK